jgi:hypothetical protein
MTVVKKSIVGYVISILVVLLAVFVYMNMSTWKLILFAVTDGFNGKWPEIHLEHCGKADFDMFFKKLVPTPTYVVESIEECFNVGEKMAHPLICRLDKEVSHPELVIEAIKADNTTYDLICREGGDVHWLRPNDVVQGTIPQMLNGEINKWCMAGFIYGPEHQALLHKVIPGLNETFDAEELTRVLKNPPKDKQDLEVKVTTSFVSDFPEAMISSGSHAAMAVSGAFQLFGTKIWIMHNMEESDGEYWFRTSWRYFPVCLSDWFKQIKKPWVAVTNPGDILYFPMAYQHFVFTPKGLNFMTNIRKAFKPSGAYIRERFNWKQLAKIAADKIIIKGFQRGNPRDSAAELGAKAVLRATAEKFTTAEEKAQIKHLGQRLMSTYLKNKST